MWPGPRPANLARTLTPARLLLFLASPPFFAVFRAFSSNTSRTREAKTPGSCTGRGPRAVRSHNERLPHAASRCLLRTRCPPDPLRIPSIPSQTSRSLGPPGKPYPLLLPSSTSPWLPLFLVLWGFPERHVGDNCFVWNLPVNAVLLPAWVCSEALL